MAPSSTRWGFVLVALLLVGDLASAKVYTVNSGMTNAAINAVVQSLVAGDTLSLANGWPSLPPSPNNPPVALGG